MSEEKSKETLEKEILSLRRRIKELESENFIAEAILNLAPIGIVVINEYKIEYANNVFHEILKIKDENLFQKNFLQFIPKNNLEEFKKRVEKAVKKSPVQRVKEEFLDSNNETVYVETSIIPILFNGKNSALLLIVDRSEEVRYQRKLYENEMKFKSLAENSLVGIYLIEDEKIVFCNEKYAEILGEKSCKDVIGRSVYDFIHPDDIEKAKSEIEKRVKREEQFSHYIVRHRRDNEIRFHEVFGSTVEFGDKKILSGVLIDITDRILTEKKLEESEKTYRGIIDSIEEAIYIQNKNGIFLDVNKGAEKMYGYSKEELIGKNPGDVSAPGLNDMDEVLKKFLTTLNKGIPQEFEFWGKRKDGSSFPKNVRLYKGTYFGEDVVIAVAQDITEKKKMQKEKEAINQRMQKSQKLKSLGTLAGGIAHDFNNLLTPIMGYAEIIQKINKDNKIKKYISLIMESSKRAKKLVENILSYSKDNQTEMGIVYIQDEIEKVLDLLKESIPSTINIRKKIDKKCKPLYANPTQIQQVIMNLCTNAFKAMEGRGGDLEIILKEITKKNLPENMGYLKGSFFAKIVIKDNGIGMDEETLNNIFEPFYTTREKGTGLGMFIVSSVVEAYNGDIFIKSIEGEGTEVVIYLPVFSKKELAGKEKKRDKKLSKVLEEKITGKKKNNVLVVDDEKIITEMLQEALSLEGFKVKAFNDSRKALKHFKRNVEKYNFVITDLTMPKLTGIELSEEIKKIKPDIPIILLTGYKQEISEEMTKKYNIKRVLLKPINIHTLIKTLKELY